VFVFPFAGYSYGDSFREKNERKSSSEGDVSVGLECVFLPAFFEREIAGHLICCFCFGVFDIHDIKACSFGFHFFIKPTMAAS
jgi:hypothetical protein